ncbi:SDR family NAD(P)-dependent oxidoreductase [Actinopolyspora sp. H202]|uniref:SDR family NAD(P)-dependent oxidoreductase n=1 Tax=Actinopolyspora sp. H202 TaxID=1500456 RepID=UPI003EE626A7
MTYYDNEALVQKATEFLEGLLAEITKLPRARVDARAGFESFGIDSVMAMTMTTRMEAVFGTLPKTLFFEFDTPHELARHLATTRQSEVSSLFEEVVEDTGAPVDGVPVDGAPASRPDARPTSALRRKPLASTRWSAQKTAQRSVPAPGDRAVGQERQGVDIAIIGLAGRYPEARTVDEFWANLAAGRDSVTEIPAERWDQAVYFDPDPDAPGKTYSRWGGFVDGVDEFDPLLFNISPADAERMDPQERLFLQCVHETVEDAGYTSARLNAPSDSGHPHAVGVYVGVMYSEYQLYGAQEQVLGNPVALPGNISAVANRVSHCFDFRGPSMGVDTMCSSSLTAVQLACQAIRSGGCDLAVAGGVNVSVHPNKYLLLGESRFVSSTGRCESFGKGGDGYVPGEGVGAVLLKPLERAVQDRDYIHGVIRGVAINHGGRTNGYSVPSPAAQASAITEAWRQGGIDPRSIGYIEAHGTGTALGDPIEVAGLTRAFREHTGDEGFCAIGSVKSNIGHAESAAGMSGLTKVLLQMRHGKLAPSLHSTELNPNLDLDGTPFTVQQTLADWPQPYVAVDGVSRESPRIAGISSFGAGGANAHLVVEEFRPDPDGASDLAPASGAPVPVVLSARTAEQLRQKAAQLADWIEQKNLSTGDLPALAHTLQVGREAMRERLGVVVDAMPDLLARLRDFGVRNAAEGLVRGRAGDDTASRSAADVSDALARRDLATLLRSWVEGNAVDWQALHGGQPSARIALPTYPFARTRYWIDTTRTAAALSGGAAARSEAAVTEETDGDPAALLFTESWEPQDLQAIRRADVPRTLVCLCTDSVDRAELARIAHELDPAVTLLFVTRGPGFAAVSGNCYEVDDRTPDDLVRVFEDILSRYGAVDGVLNLWFLDGAAAPDSYTATVHLLQAIAVSGLPVERVLQAGEFCDGVERAYLESWLGFERSIGSVLPGVRFVAVLQEVRDTSDGTAHGMWFERLWNELSAETSISALYRDGARHVSRVQPSTSGTSRDLLRPGGTYLVTGGMGGLGLSLAEHLAENRSARLVLTGRSPLDATKSRHIARIESLGGEVLYRQADSADRQAMREVVASAHERFGPIHGIVHAAGVAAHSSLLADDARSFRDLLSAKVDGTLALDDVLTAEPLDFVCYFSSTSAVLGDFGNCAYSVANRFQTSYARHRDQQVRKGNLSGATVAINWPLWSGGGMGFDDAQGAEVYLSTSGLRLLGEAEGLALFERLLGRATTQQIVMAGDPARVRRMLGVDPDPTAPRREVLPATPATTRATRSADVPAEESDLEALVLSDLETAIAELSRIPHEQVYADENFFELGFDSVSLAKLAKTLGEDFAIEVLPSVFFSYPTPQKLVTHLVAEHRELLDRHYASTAADVPAAGAAAGTQVGGVAAEDCSGPAPQSMSGTDPEPIAVIGMSGRFPAARSVDEFWRILLEGRDVLSSVPADRRADWDELDAEQREQVRCGFLPGIAEFDAAFFEISPREAQTMDPRQRLLLQEAWRALEDAGYGDRRLRAGAIGMFVGAEQGDYSDLTQGQSTITSQHEAIMASRLAYLLDFSGPVLTVNTACSSALTAAHQACTSLRGGECETAIVAGANVASTARGYTEMSKAGMLSDSGVCQAFDQRADGLVLGEAVAVVVLKRLSRAEADGDRVLGVIRGSGMNYDGRTNSITAPSGTAQTQLYQQVYERHGIDPECIEHIVAHGTGTRLGDPVEVNALNEAYRERTNKIGFCALTSTKTNVGHTLAASGLVGMISLIQSLRHGVIPASLHCEQDSDYIAWKDSPFYVNKAAAQWQTGPTGTRLGAVSSFGMSGTNVHMVVESYPESTRSAPLAGPPARLLLLSAKTPEALHRQTQELRSALAGGELDARRLNDTAYTLLNGRQHLAHRCAVVVGGAEDTLDALSAAESGLEHPMVRRGEVARDRDRSLLEVQSRALLDELRGPDVSAERYREVCCSLADLYCQGAVPDWPALFEGDRPRFVSLPGYPFARSQHWATDGRPAPTRTSTQEVLPGPKATTQQDALPVSTEPTAPCDVPPKKHQILLQDPDAARIAPTVPVGKPQNVVLTDLHGTAEREVVAGSAASAPVGRGVVGSGWSLSGLREELRSGLAAALFLSESEVDPYRNFVELGLDSIVGVEWVKSINKQYGTSLTATRLYDYPSVAELAAFLESLVSGGEVGSSGRDVGGVGSGVVSEGGSSGVRDGVEREIVEPGRSGEVASREPEPSAIRPDIPYEAIEGPATATVRASLPREDAPPTAPPGERAAVIGMSGRYPGAENLRQYWTNLRDGRDCVREVPADRWDITRYYDARPGQKGKTYCRSMGYLEDADCFDPLFFNISPAEAEGMDPQHRLFLQEAYRAFEDAGYDPRSLSRMKCGVYLGVSGNEYSFLIFESGDDGDVVGTSNSNAIAAARIAYFLNLKGPAIAVDTACSSSLVALNLAQQALASGEIDVALVGGVSLYLLASSYVRMAGANMLSAQGQCRSFDKGADGFVPSEGVGALVLKRLSDAEVDHDHIHGVLLASGTNQDGKTNGITAPSANSQIDLVRTVYDRHDIDAASIGYVEMHGTGTTLGDAIELDALGTVYRERGVTAGSCAIGSVKSNIGHASAAAGIAGVHKALLGMRQGLLVPSLHYETPNELLETDHCPFYVNTDLDFWKARGDHDLRRAAVSSFGFSGTNAHVVLEEYRHA